MLERQFKRTLEVSEDDIKNLILKNGKIRLCKGAYGESPKIAFRAKQEISSNFTKLMKLLFREGNEFAIRLPCYFALPSAYQSNLLIFRIPMLENIPVGIASHP